MKKYILLLLFLINFAFVFQKGKITVSLGTSAMAQFGGEYELNEVVVVGYMPTPEPDPFPYVEPVIPTLNFDDWLIPEVPDNPNDPIVPTSDPSDPGNTGAFTQNEKLSNAFNNTLDKVTGKLHDVFQALLNEYNSKIYFVPTTSGELFRATVSLDANGHYVITCYYNTAEMSKLTDFAASVVAIHEMYHFYRDTNPANSGTTNEIDHANMASDIDYFNWLKEAFPGHTDDFYNDLKYAGTIGSPVFENLNQECKEELVKFFEKNYIY